MSGYRNLVHFKMLAAQVAQGHDEAGRLDEEQVTCVRLAFAELRDRDTVEARQYLMDQMIKCLSEVPENIVGARPWMTLHKAVSR